MTSEYFCSYCIGAIISWLGVMALIAVMAIAKMARRVDVGHGEGHSTAMTVSAAALFSAAGAGGRQFLKEISVALKGIHARRSFAAPGLRCIGRGSWTAERRSGCAS